MGYGCIRTVLRPACPPPSPGALFDPVPNQGSNNSFGSGIGLRCSDSKSVLGLPMIAIMDTTVTRHQALPPPGRGELFRTRVRNFDPRLVFCNLSCPFSLSSTILMHFFYLHICLNSDPLNRPVCTIERTYFNF